MATKATEKLQPLFFDFGVNEYRSLNQKESGVCAFSFTQETDKDVWLIEHNRDFLNFKLSIFSNGNMVLPDNIIVIDSNLLAITFSEPTSGGANIVYQTDDAVGCLPEEIVADSVVRGINVNSINADSINGLGDLLSL